MSSDVGVGSITCSLLCCAGILRLWPTRSWELLPSPSSNIVCRSLVCPCCLSAVVLILHRHFRLPGMVDDGSPLSFSSCGDLPALIFPPTRTQQIVHLLTEWNCSPSPCETMVVAQCVHSKSQCCSWDCTHFISPLPLPFFSPSSACGILLCHGLQGRCVILSSRDKSHRPWSRCWQATAVDVPCSRRLFGWQGSNNTVVAGKGFGVRTPKFGLRSCAHSARLPITPLC